MYYSKNVAGKIGCPYRVIINTNKLDSPKDKFQMDCTLKRKQAKIHNIQKKNFMATCQEIISLSRHQSTNKKKTAKFDHVIIRNIYELKDTLNKMKK